MHEFAAVLVRADPATARQVGVLDPQTGRPTLALPATDPAFYARLEETIAGWAGPVLSPEGSREWLEERCLQAEVAYRLHELRVARPWQRAPYWYAEVLGDALTALDPDHLGDHAYATAYLDLLDEAATFLDAGRASLTPELVPSRWATMAIPAVAGLRTLIADELPDLDAALPTDLAGDADRRRTALLGAMDAFGQHCDALTTAGAGTWAVGEETFTGLLRDYHLLNLSPDEIWEHGWAKVTEVEQGLTELAAVLDPARTWPEQIEALKAERTPGPEFVNAYRAEVQTSIGQTLEHDLLSVPADQECVVAPLPQFRRAGLPLGEMRTVPPYASSMVSQFLITPADPDATPERQAGHERDNCPTFIRSIVGHETYPGHHLQSVHHVLGTAEDSFLRFFRTPLFVEGWGLYVEDILEERVFGQSTQALFARRNTLWRSLRLVIDTGLHTGRLTHEDAVQLLVERTGMDHHMAAGEVDRYTRHDNPTYPSTYVLGRDMFHELRATFAAVVPGGQGRLHDALLRYGSPPVSLLEPVLRREFGAAP
ncbi:DUF885 family protein [Pseudactinotalea sp. Z1732]|uniref:DUF885 family protein n=1 Tax=Pseudactinotalea sp. Z1732 TaxID=3413026 RepID=UPI003C7DF52B